MLGPDEVIDVISQGTMDVPAELKEKYGVIPRAVNQIFTEVNRVIEAHGATCEIKVRYFEIYNEQVNDLLAANPKEGANLKLHESRDGSFIIGGCNAYPVLCPDDIFDLLMMGQRSRAVASTQQNERSSRSHTIFQLECEQRLTDGSCKRGKLNLVDLAGSERLAKSNATGKQLKESTKINQSLT